MKVRKIAIKRAKTAQVESNENIDDLDETGFQAVAYRRGYRYGFNSYILGEDVSKPNKRRMSARKWKVFENGCGDGNNDSEWVYVVGGSKCVHTI